MAEGWSCLCLCHKKKKKKTLNQMCKTTIDSIIMNDKEMWSPLFNSPLFMQEDLMIYDYRTEGCLFLTKKPNKTKKNRYVPSVLL